MSNERAQFATRMGAIATAVGSAIGLGNIWRFPFVTGENGGAAFLIIYLVAVAVLGIPLLVSEFTIGRTAKQGAVKAYKALAPKTAWCTFGYLGMLGNILIIAFYGVVAGWTIEFLAQAITGGFNATVEAAGAEPNTEAATQALRQAFTGFSTDPWQPIVWMAMIVAINFAILLGGVTKGIERASNVMMPLLFVLIVILCANSFTLSGFSEGMRFLFQPDFSKVNSGTIILALGQAFFSISVGVGTMTAYGSYMNPKTNVVRTAATIGCLDTLIAIMSGIVIFPACFSYDVSPEAGPGLLFLTMPNVFMSMPGGYFWSIVFFSLIALAAITSTISMFETVTIFIQEEWNLSRNTALYATCLLALVLGSICSLSFGVLSGATVFGKTAFDLCDFTSSNLIMPVGALGASLFVGWRMKDVGLPWVVTFVLRYLAPAFILTIFVMNLV